MTKTNLVGLMLAVLVLTGFSAPTEAAHAKSVTEIAKIHNSIIIEPVLDKADLQIYGVVEVVPAKWRIQNPNKGMVAPYMDTNVPEVWKGVDPEIRRFLSCAADHESSHSRYANNPESSASGKYQMIFKTWSGNAKWVKVKGEGKMFARKYDARKYANGPASKAPAWLQEAAAIHSVEQGGWHHWNGTHCGHGT